MSAWNPAEFALAQEKQKANGHLEWALAEMKKSLTTFMKCLKEIHEKKSYRFKHATFEDFCQEELKITPRRGLQLVTAQNLRVILESSLPEGSQVAPEELQALPEGQLRELAKVSPERAVEALEATAGTKRTAKRLREHLGLEKPVKPTIVEAHNCAVDVCPHCGHSIP